MSIMFGPPSPFVGTPVEPPGDGAPESPIRYTNESIVRAALAAGANAGGEEGNLALKLATGDGNVGVVRMLLEAGADVRARDDSALRCAVENGQVDMAGVLLAAGANVHAEDNEALIWAASQGDISMVRVLMAAGANVFARGDAAIRRARFKGHAAVAAALGLSRV